ncbi:transposase (fragment) [Xenorhabdus nematophila AN6/1]
MRLEHQHGRRAEWIQAQLSKKHSNVVACALARAC